MIPITKIIDNYWNYYLLLEEKFINTFKYVELNQDNFDTYSNEYMSLMYAIGAEVDSFLKVFCNYNANDYKNMEDYGKYIITNNPEILELRVIVREKRILLSPFNLKENTIDNNKVLFWWKAYDNIKHSRHLNTKDGNLKNTLYLLSALYLLEVIYIKKSNPTYIPINNSKLFILIENEEDWVKEIRNFRIVEKEK